MIESARFWVVATVCCLVGNAVPLAMICAAYAGYLLGRAE